MHGTKTEDLIAKGEAHCQKARHRFTPPRKAVLEIIARAKTPAGAYDIIKKMPRGTKAPTVYRALEFWEEEGFIHCIKSLNAYIACRAGHRHEGAQFLICHDCDTVTETHICHTPPDIAKMAYEQSFIPDGWFLEMHGLCKKCVIQSRRLPGGLPCN
jgi:Fur family transcriptional regulator, zinc uptake regulator